MSRRLLSGSSVPQGQSITSVRAALPWPQPPCCTAALCLQIWRLPRKPHGIAAAETWIAGAERSRNFPHTRSTGSLELHAFTHDQAMSSSTRSPSMKSSSLKVPLALVGGRCTLCRASATTRFTSSTLCLLGCISACKRAAQRLSTSPKVVILLGLLKVGFDFKGLLIACVIAMATSSNLCQAHPLGSRPITV